MNVGSRIGAYEVIAKLGEGGMGEVYRAKDSRLKREVALKVLPPVVAHDAERLARFQREAEVLASLNHPHIAQIYGIEDAGPSTGSGQAAVLAIVMELVDGEDLAQRIARGPIPLDEVLVIGKQLTEALSAAHDAGIVHRDLKPANIKVRADGTVKVLDFGLARPSGAGASGASSASSASSANSPTITSPAVTHAGMILGTAAYMAPEQAKGKFVDKRADIWAFGCVVYEMLTAERVFQGEGLTDVLASVVRDQPDLSKAPPTVRRLLNKCLEKDPRRRLRDIGDAWELLETGAAADVFTPHARRAWLPWAIAAVLALVAVALGTMIIRRPVTAAPPRVQFQLPIPEEAGAIAPVVSPDGRRILYSHAGQVWIRELDALAPTRVPEADAVISWPIWTADSRFVLFSAAGALKKADASGGPSQTICQIRGVLFGGFTAGDRVIFATAPGELFEAPLAGGAASPLSWTGSPGLHSIRGGSALLPDGQHFLYTTMSPAEDARGIFVASLNDKSTRRLLPDVSSVAYVRASTGASDYLVFMRGGALLAQSFDAVARQLIGEPIQIVGGVKTFSASQSGSIAYRAGSAGRRLTWRDRQGKVLGVVGSPANHLEVSLSPDGTRAAVVRDEMTAPPSTWIFDFARDASSRLPFARAAIKPIWSRDGKHLFVTTGVGTTAALVRTASDGRGGQEQLVTSRAIAAAKDVSPDGKWLLYVLGEAKTKEDLWLLPLTPGEQKPEPFLVTDFIETDAMFSPDGRFVAYVSNESGAFEVYVRSFPVSAGGKWRVSQGGGYQPRWRRDGKELFFVTGDGRLMSTDVRTSVTFEHAAPRTLFPVPIFAGGATTTNHYWDVSADGQRFLINTVDQDEGSSMLTVVLNWQSGLSAAGRN